MPSTRRLSLAPLLALAAVAASFGCTTIIGADWDKPFQTASTGGAAGAGGGTSSSSSAASSSSSGAASSSSGSPVDAGPDADAGPICTTQSATYKAAADTIIIKSSCGAIVYGNAEHASVNANITSYTLLRFKLNADMAALSAIEGGKATKVTLTLTRTPDGGDCGASCPSAAGQIRAYPLRNDWVEGMGASYDGATWCLRVPPSTHWDADGAAAATDRGPSAGVQSITGSEGKVQLDLDPATFTGWLDTTKGELSLLLTPENGAVYVFATKEHASLPAAALDVDYCP